MFYLIKKDLLIQKKSVLLSILLIVLFSFYFFKLGSAALPMSVLAITYMFTLSASAIEEKNKGDQLLISLPIKKSTIVLAKYFSILVFASYVIILNAIIYLLVHILHLPLNSIPITMDGVVTSFVTSSFFGAFSLPIIFKYGYLKSRMINFILFFLIMIGGTTFIDYISTNYPFVTKIFFNQPDVIKEISILILSSFIFIGSYVLSYNFYKKREF